MKISCILLIFYTSLNLREIAAYLPYVHTYEEEHTPLLLVAGFLAILFFWRNRRPLTVATSTTRRTSTTRTTSTTSTPSTTRTTSTTSTPSTTRTTSTTSTPSTTRTTSTTTTPPPQCSDGYTLYPGPGRSFCYRLSPDCKKWDEARMACMVDNGDLTVLDGDSLLPFADTIFRLYPFPGYPDCSFKHSVWLNAKTNNENVAIYPDGQTIPSDSKLWASKRFLKPNECIDLVFNVESLLYTNPCDFSFNYICQKF